MEEQRDLLEFRIAELEEKTRVNIIEGNILVNS